MGSEHKPWPDAPFTAAEVEKNGISRERLRNAVASRDVVRVLRGVYLRSDVVLDTKTKAAAASKVVSSHSVICDRTAAWLHGIDVMRYAELESVPPLETYTFRGHRATDRPECSGGSRDLLAEDWQWIGELRVTTPLRTALDLACNLPRREAMAALDAFMRAFGLTHAEMQRLLRRYRRRRGVVQARELVPLADGRAESGGESWTRLEIVTRGLPTPKPQHWIVIDGVPTFRLDLAYPHARVVVEYDGEEYHSDPEARERDEARRDWLRRHKWHVIVVTKDSFTAEACDQWIRELRTVLAERGALGRR
jgi:hypothetical protein